MELFNLLSFLDWEANDVSVIDFKNKIMEICNRKDDFPFFSHTFIFLGDRLGAGSNHPITNRTTGFLDMHRDLIYCLHGRFRYRTDNKFQRLFYVEIPNS